MINFRRSLKLPTIDGNLVMFCQKKSSVVTYVNANNHQLQLIPHQEGFSLAQLINMNLELEGAFLEGKINLCFFEGFTADLVLYLLRHCRCFVKILHDFKMVDVFV